MLKELDRIDVAVNGKTRSIVLAQGNLARIDAAQRVDLLVISAFPGDYTATPTSMIGQLARNGVSVAELASMKAMDLRAESGAWLSRPVEAAGFDRLVCFEPQTLGAPPIVVGELFRALFPFLESLGSDESRDHSVAMPLLATGDAGWSDSQMMAPLLEAATRWLQLGLPISTLYIVAHNAPKAAAMKAAFSEFKEDDPPASGTFAPVASEFAFEDDNLKEADVPVSGQQASFDSAVWSSHGRSRGSVSLQFALLVALALSGLSWVLIGADAVDLLSLGLLGVMLLGLLPAYRLEVRRKRVFGLGQSRTKTLLFALMTIAPFFLVAVIDLQYRSVWPPSWTAIVSAAIGVGLVAGLYVWWIRDSLSRLGLVRSLSRQFNKLDAPELVGYDKKIFLSYSSTDADAARRVLDGFRVASPGVMVFEFRRDIPIGVSYQTRIDEALAESDRVLCLLSPDYIQSPECQEELMVARLRNKRAGFEFLWPVYWREVHGGLTDWLMILNLADCRESSVAQLDRTVTRLASELLKN
ncbi:toll/interleukin-1 receptor domain-containing protein [Primorskyibacter marinus]|uniref:toll/interleukin-1 receptor domain-containing protein n=1 Tax=Primorskyibacter marinus TaxID=1977320 RepID=UPI000E30A681|nr:toll/interleukin-1 receptor domain-containing protein [Primorskyibacter marinus]